MGQLEDLAADRGFTLSRERDGRATWYVFTKSDGTRLRFTKFDGGSWTAEVKIHTKLVLRGRDLKGDPPWTMSREAFAQILLDTFPNRDAVGDTIELELQKTSGGWLSYDPANGWPAEQRPHRIKVFQQNRKRWPSFDMSWPS